MPDIVCTIGPASRSPAVREKLRACTHRFRLNTGHLDSTSLCVELEQLASLARGGLADLRVTLDLQGAKIRIGQFPRVTLPPGPVVLRLSEASDDPRVIPVPFPCVFEQACPGEDLLLLNDGKIRLQVVGQPRQDELQALCLQGGELGSAKGLNRPGRPYRLSTISDRDRAAISIGMAFPFVDFAISFVASEGDAALFRPLTGSRRLVGKVERLVALDALVEIDRAFDELWLCRGDLGTEVALSRLGEVQARFASLFPQLSKPRLLAGEVLGSMVQSPFPSRSEIVHLSDAMHAGFDGIVLSDETAVGNHVEEVIGFLRDFFPERTQERP